MFHWRAKGGCWENVSQGQTSERRSLGFGRDDHDFLLIKSSVWMKQESSDTLASTSSSSHSESMSRIFVSCFEKYQQSATSTVEITYLDIVAGLSPTRHTFGILDGNRGSVRGDSGALKRGILSREVKKSRERGLRRRKNQNCARARTLRDGRYLPRRELNRIRLRLKRAGCLDTLESGGSQTRTLTEGETQA